MLGGIAMVTLNMARADPTMASSSASDAHSRETIMEVPARVCHMAATLETINGEGWEHDPSQAAGTRYNAPLWQDYSVKGLKKGRCQC